MVGNNTPMTIIFLTASIFIAPWVAVSRLLMRLHVASSCFILLLLASICFLMVREASDIATFLLQKHNMHFRDLPKQATRGVYD